MSLRILRSMLSSLSQTSSGWCLPAILAVLLTLVLAASPSSLGQVIGPAPAPKSSAPAPTVKQPAGTSAARPAHPAAGHSADTQPALPPDPPPIAFRPDLLDLGTIRPGQHARGSVEVVNTSEKVIRILSSQASCTCTSVNLANSVLQPGEAVPLPVEFKGTNSLGPRKMSVRVRVEGFRDLAEVPMRVTIALPVHADPASITALKDSNTGAITLSGIVRVFSEDHKPFRILSVQGRPPAYEGFDPAKDDLRDQYQLKWDLTGYDEKTCADKNGSPMPLWLAVETDHPDCGVLDIEIRHECTRRSYLKPGDSWLMEDRRSNIGRVKPGVPLEITLAARWLPKVSHDQLPLLVTSESPQFTVQMTDVKPSDDGFEVHVKITPKAAHRGLIYGNLRVHSQEQQWPVTIIGTAQE